jgi:tetratricopeptide (TPR) repeat protein
VNTRSHHLLLALIALAAVLPFLPARNAPFLEWDDLLNLVYNPHWRGFSRENARWMLTTVHDGHYQPLSWLSYALDYSLWGPNPAAMRATNYVLHALCATLFFLIGDELIRRAAPAATSRDRTAAALFATLFWAVHPLRVESVVWLTERRDVLSGFFYLGCVLLYLKDPDKPLRPLCVYCFAVLSKASVITLPVTLLLLDLWPLSRRSWADKIPYFLISAVAGLAGLAGQWDAGALRGLEVGLGERLAFGVHSLWWYAAKTVWPSGLSPYHRVPPGFGLASPSVWGAALGVLAAGAAAWRSRRRAPAATAALLQYAVILAPMAGFARFGHHLVAERYSYLPGLALSALAGAGFLAARHRKPWRVPATAAAAVLVLACGVVAARGARYWSGTESLWKRALEVDPSSAVPRVNLASYYRHANRIDEALAEERAAVALDPRRAKQLSNLGADAVEKKNFIEAERLLRAAVSAEPELAIAHYNLAAALDGRGQRTEALAALEQAARIDFDNPKILNNLGVALSFAGEHARAEAALKRATELAPGWALAHHNRGNALSALGRAAQARAAYAEAARLDSRFGRAGPKTTGADH